VGNINTIMFMETGWPTSGTGNEAEQKYYIRRLPELLETVNTSIVAWALLHDVNLSEFDANLNTVGIVSNSGREKPAFKAFRLISR